jgi:hypothetical protein
MRSASLHGIAPGVIAAVAAALVGCASTHGPGYAASRAPIRPRAAALPGTPACFRLADFAGSRIWVALNDSELIVADPVFSRSYLIRLSEPVYALKLRHFLDFEPFMPASGCICNGSNDYLLAAHSGLAGHVPIAAVRELSRDEERQLLRTYHIGSIPGPHVARLGRRDNGCPKPSG